MSLINDALKKARTSRPAGAGASTAAGPELRPTDAPARAPLLSLPLVIALILILAIIMFWAWYHAGRVDLVVRANSRVTSVSASTAKSSVPPIATLSTPPTVATPVDSNAAVGPVAETVSAGSTNDPNYPDLPRASAPSYRLEGIFYRAKHPAAVINGQMVFAGSRLDDARVLAIDRESATIVTSSGETNLLTLPY